MSHNPDAPLAALLRMFDAYATAAEEREAAASTPAPTLRDDATAIRASLAAEQAVVHTLTAAAAQSMTQLSHLAQVESALAKTSRELSESEMVRKSESAKASAAAASSAATIAACQEKIKQLESQVAKLTVGNANLAEECTRARKEAAVATANYDQLTKALLSATGGPEPAPEPPKRRK